MGWEKNLVKYIKKTDYQNIPLERGIIVNNVSTIFAIYEALKYKKPLTERIVTFTGENLKRPQNVLVKNGTMSSEIIEKVGGIKKKNTVFVAGGPMMGKKIESNEMIINIYDNCVLLVDEPNEPETQCLRCGKCVLNCPAKLSPILIRDAKQDKNKLNKLEPNRCIECGLCSYICPAKINIRNAVKEAKELMRKEN